MIMKKVLFFLASALILASCENFYIDQNLGGSDYNPTDVRTIDYTLTDADYKNIVSNKDNIAIAEATLVADSLGVVDSTEYKAFWQIAEDLAFNKLAVADVYVPAYLTAKFPQLSKGSLFNITYKNSEGAPAYLKDFAATSKYTLSVADYESIWGEGKEGTHYLTPATMAGLTSVLPAEAEEGAILAVVYDYKSQEPIFVTEEEEVVLGFFDGTPETRGYYTPAEVIAAYAAGTLQPGDSLKVGGILGEWYSKSLNPTYGNLDYYLYDQDGTSRFEMWRSFSLNSALWASYDYVDKTNATATDVNGYSITVGDTIIGIGAFKYYADYDVYEFDKGCYIVEHRPVSAAPAAPKKAAAANQDGKKTVLYQYTEGKWKTYKNDAATVVALPEDVYTAVGFNYLLEKNKNVLTTFLAQEYPYAQAGKAYTVVYVAAVDKETNVPTYNAIEFVYDGAAFVENLGISIATSTFSLSDVWGSTIYYKQAIMGEGQGKLTIQDEFSEPLTRVWYYSAAYGMCASGFVNNESHPCDGWLITPMIDLSRAKNPEFSFDHAFNKAEGDFLNECSVLVTTSYTGNVKDEANNWIPLEWNTLEDGTLDVPAGTSWTFQPTGKLDMSQFVGEKIHIAFRYHITEKRSGTWEIKNLLLCEPEN